MLNPNIYEKSIKIIEDRRKNAILENEKHILEIDLKIPEVKEINQQLAKTSSTLFHIIRKNENVNQEIEKLKNQNLYAQRMIRNHLLSHDYPADYLNIKYTCESCFDTGFVGGYRCDCLKKLIKQISAKELNQSSNMPLTSFNDFSIDYYKDSKDQLRLMKISLEYCKNYAENFSLSSPSLLMLGGTGTGKTHLSLAIADTVLSKEFSVLYDSAANYLRMIEKEHFNSDIKTDTLQTLIDADLVILDDLGTEFVTAFYSSTLYTLINTRLARNIPTIISTNFSQEELHSRYENRLISRIFFCFEMLKFTGKDIRQIKREREKLQYNPNNPRSF